MSYAPSPYGPVTIIPATAMRENRQVYRSRRSEDMPINAAYYLTPPNVQQDDGSRVYYDATYGARQIGTLAPPETYRASRSRYRQSNEAVPPTGPPSSITYNRRSKSQSRSRAQSRSPELGRRHHSAGTAYAAFNGTSEYRPRAYTSGLFADPQYPHSGNVPIRSFSGPSKYPVPMYRKQRYSAAGATLQRNTGTGSRRSFRRSKSAEVYPGDPFPIGVYGPHSGGDFIGPGYLNSAGGGGGLRRYYKYAPTYTTYPPSTVYRQRQNSRGVAGKYKTLHRAIIKIAQIIVGIIVIALICGATRGVALHNFAAATKSQGQMAVVALASICLIFTVGLLLSISFASRSQVWRSIDTLFNGFAAVLYLICACVEAWYASCYPPYGEIYGRNIACRLPEWAVATVFAFVNVFLYLADFGLALRASDDFNLL